MPQQDGDSDVLGMDRRRFLAGSAPDFGSEGFAWASALRGPWGRPC
jgi:hypothetical protein